MLRPRIDRLTLCAGLVLALSACTPSDQKTANEHAADAERKLDHAGEVAKQEAAQAGTKIDKATLVARVKAALAMDAGLRSMTTVSVEATGDTIQLHGTVQTEAEKQEVERAASHVNGVAHVEDDVTVQP